MDCHLIQTLQQTYGNMDSVLSHISHNCMWIDLSAQSVYCNLVYDEKMFAPQIHDAAYKTILIQTNQVHVLGVINLTT